MTISEGIYSLSFYNFEQPDNKDILNLNEECCKKLLLLDKIKSPTLTVGDKMYIMRKQYCWDILFKDKQAAKLCFLYARNIVKGRFKKGESVIKTSPYFSFLYIKYVLKKRDKYFEEIILQDPLVVTQYVLCFKFFALSMESR